MSCCCSFSFSLESRMSPTKPVTFLLVLILGFPIGVFSAKLGASRSQHSSDKGNIFLAIGVTLTTVFGLLFVLFICVQCTEEGLGGLEEFFQFECIKDDESQVDDTQVELDDLSKCNLAPTQSTYIVSTVYPEDVRRSSLEEIEGEWSDDELVNQTRCTQMSEESDEIPMENDLPPHPWPDLYSCSGPYSRTSSVHSPDPQVHHLMEREISDYSVLQVTSEEFTNPIAKPKVIDIEINSKLVLSDDGSTDREDEMPEIN